MPPRDCPRDAPEACTAGFCTRRDCDAMPPRTFQVPLITPSTPDSLMSRQATHDTPRGKLVGDVQRVRTW
eukprot:3749098-Prymnesium_polylepis.1